MKLLLALVLSLSIISVAACEDSTKSHEFRYKLTVTLDTPEGEVSGSSVQQVTMTVYKDPTHRNGVSVGEDFKGEAVVVDMGDRGVLFGALRTDPERVLYRTVEENVEGSYQSGYQTVNGVTYLNSLPVGTKADVPVRYWPRFVTFTDLDDPKTVQSLLSIEGCYAGRSDEVEAKCDEIGPYVTENNLEKYFGEGVRLKDITIEITDEPVTQGVVDEYLPWLKKYGGSYISGKSYGDNRDLYRSLHGGNFKIGVKSNGK